MNFHVYFLLAIPEITSLISPENFALEGSADEVFLETITYSV
jgi:hypothetical protein